MITAALIGLLSMLAGLALGWYLRRSNDWCSHWGVQLSCNGCCIPAAWPRRRVTEAVH